MFLPLAVAFPSAMLPSSPLPLFFAALVVLAASGTAALLCTSRPVLANSLGSGGAAFGCLLGLATAIAAIISRETPSASWQWQVPYGSLSFGLDPLSSVFLVAIFGLGALAALFGARYMVPFSPGKGLGAPWFFYSLLLASMAVVVASRNGVLFLVAWEIMALASFFLVTFQHERAEVRRAGWVYLVAAHVGTAFLLVFFALAGRETGSLDFDKLTALKELSSGTASVVFLFAVVGFGTKAGLLPMHVWLPEAHPAAPSHVSAIMSGVMIKTGVYGILRTLTFLGTLEPWWGMLLIVLGLASGLFGIVFALAQRDLKRMLAYSSIENAGIITVGIGTGVLGLSSGIPALALLGFSGALLHSLNHAVIKGLLFLAAGSIIHATGERDMDRLGGLMKVLPVTGVTFLVGAAAISGLPPLSGFASEFLLIFAGLAGGLSLGGGSQAILLASAAGIVLISCLALACFVKVLGMVLLGTPRVDLQDLHPNARGHQASARGHQAEEPAFTIPLAALAALCVLLGFLSVPVVAFVLPAAAQVSRMSAASASALSGVFTAPLASTVAVAAAASGMAALLAGLRWLLLCGRTVGRSVTWDCGYERPTSRMQYTASSFSQPLIDLFEGLLRTRRRARAPAGYFPQQASFRTETPDVFADRLYRPVLAAMGWSSGKLHLLQQGRVHLYLVYILATLVVLLVWKLA